MWLCALVAVRETRGLPTAGRLATANRGTSPAVNAHLSNQPWKTFYRNETLHVVSTYPYLTFKKWCPLGSPCRAPLQRVAYLPGAISVFSPKTCFGDFHTSQSGSNCVVMSCRLSIWHYLTGLGYIFAGCLPTRSIFHIFKVGSVFEAWVQSSLSK
jgi:hypothetical protein